MSRVISRSRPPGFEAARSPSGRDRLAGWSVRRLCPLRYVTALARSISHANLHVSSLWLWSRALTSTVPSALSSAPSMLLRVWLLVSMALL